MLIYVYFIVSIHNESPTNVQGIISHHVLVMVESMLNVILMISVTKKPLQNIEIHNIST